MRRLALASLITLVGSFVPLTARAEPSAADRDSARTLMNEGDRRMEANDAKGALESYTAAHAIMGVPTTGAAAASAHHKLGQVVEARDLCLAVQRYPKASNEPAAFGAARQRCDGLLGQMEGRAASLHIEVKGLEPNVAPTITIDGQPVPFAALKVPRKVNPGNHTIVGSAPGRPDATLTVSVAEGSNREVSLVFAEAPGGPGPLATKANGAAGSTSVSGEPAPKSGPGAPAIAAIVIGATGLAVGGITGALSLSKASAAKADCVGNVCPTKNQDDADSARTFGTISNIGFGVGGAGMVIGAVLWAVGKPAAQTRTSVSLGLGTATIGGTF